MANRNRKLVEPQPPDHHGSSKWVSHVSELWLKPKTLRVCESVCLTQFLLLSVILPLPLAIQIGTRSASRRWESSDILID